MAQYNVRHPEALCECPYDKTHMIMTKKMPYHLMKCRNNYRGSDYVRCPFNASHELPRPELRYHTLHCSDKALIERDLIYEDTHNRGEGTYFHGSAETPELHEPSCINQSESWDSEVSPFPVQVVNKAIFVGESSRVDFQSFTPKERAAFLAKVRDRIPIDPSTATAPEENDVLRLPYGKPLVLDQVQARSKPATGKVSCLSENVALLQQLAKGRGRVTPGKVMDIEREVGSRPA